MIVESILILIFVFSVILRCYGVSQPLQPYLSRVPLLSGDCCSSLYNLMRAWVMWMSLYLVMLPGACAVADTSAFVIMVYFCVMPEFDPYKAEGN